MNRQIMSFEAGQEVSIATFFIGDCKNVEKFAACYRPTSCWMTYQTGTDINCLNGETQYLVTKENGKFKVYVPLVNGVIRASLFGDEKGLNIICETQKDDVTFNKTGAILYVLEGDNIYDMIQTSFEDIRGFIDTFELKKDKIIPEFIDHLGFCTYNAFYDKISEEKIVNLIKNYHENGAPTRFVVVDNGWFKHENMLLSSLTADEEKFPNGLKGFVDKLKAENVERVLIWHAFPGFWNGVDPENFPNLQLKEMYYKAPARYSAVNENEGAEAATVGQNFLPCSRRNNPVYFTVNNMSALYDKMYRSFKDAGIAGSKIDAMTWIEGLGHVENGRVDAMKKLQKAIHDSSVKYLNGELINCSSNSNDYYFTSKYTTVTRTSTDYFPNKPESHGKHILSNLYVGTCFDPLVVADWDMFQSGNTCGEFHAMSKAVSGGPIYSTDEPGKERFDIIKRLATSDGRVPRCLHNLRICEESFFTDPAKEKTITKAFNENKNSYVLALFNCCESFDEKYRVTEKIKLSCVDKLPKGKYALYSYKKGFLGIFCENSEIETTLDPLEADIWTLVPVIDGIAVIGDTDKYNPNAFVDSVKVENGKLSVSMLEECKVSIYSEKALKGCEKAGNLYECVGKNIDLNLD